MLLFYPAYLLLLKEVTKKIQQPFEAQAKPRQLEVPHLLPCSWNIHFTHCFHSGNCFQGHSLERVRCCWDLKIWLNPVKASIYTFKILVGRCNDLLILQLPKVSLTCKFLCLLNLPPVNLEWSASFLLFMYISSCPLCTGTNLKINNWWASHETEDMGLGKEASMRGIPRWSLASMWERSGSYVPCFWTTMWVWGLPETLTDLMCLLEELHIVYCSKDQWTDATVSWLLLQAARLAPNAQLETAGRVRKLEKELKLENDVEMPTTLLASRLADKVGECGIINWRNWHAVLQS